jgi:oligopeptide transport system substrate-binding protein
MAHDVFVSYSKEDKVVADTIVSVFERNNIRCWYAPRDIKPGVDWGKAITDAIKDCRVFLLVFSGHANKSQRVLDELNFAISQEATISPFRIENLEPRDAMMLHLSSRHWLDAYDPSWEKHLNKLIKTVASILEIPIIEDKLEIPKKKEEKGFKKVGVGNIIKFAVIGAIILSLGWLGLSRLIVDNTKATITPTSNVSEISTAEAGGTLDISFSNDEFELDPLFIEDNEPSILAENSFLNLTNFDFSQGKIVPEAAESWSISTDGRFYTFKIQTNIPWVTHPIGGETELETDANGEIRYLTAHDFVYTIHRICDPNIALKGFGPYFIPMIKGCQVVKDYADPGNIPNELFDEISAKAISDDELLIELEDPAAYFLTMTSMTNFAAVPQWAIKKYGDAWKSPGIIPTNGYYVIDEFKLGESIHLVRNKYLTQNLFGIGNIDFVNIRIGIDKNKAYDLWLDSQIDYASIPMDKIVDHLDNYSDEVLEISGQGVVFWIFNYQEMPFYNIHVRRAFAAAFDNITYVDELKYGQGKPINHIGIPGLVGAPPIEEIGVGYNPEYARSELLAAGYPNCNGFPQVKLSLFSNQSISDEFLRSWEIALGCPENTITAQISENAWIESADIYLAGWLIDYPDENNLISDVLSCDSGYWDSMPSKRECNEIDNLILQAQNEINPDERSALYSQIEEDFFGIEGEFPVAPIYIRVDSYAVRPWIEPSIDLSHYTAFYKWKMDTNAKKAAKGE